MPTSTVPEGALDFRAGASGLGARHGMCGGLSRQSPALPTLDIGCCLNNGQASQPKPTKPDSHREARGPNCAECRDLQTRRKTGARPRQVTGTYAAQGALPVRWCCPLRNTQGCCRWNGMKNCCRTDGRPCCCETGECCDSNGPGNDSGRDLPTTARAEVAGS